MSVLRSTALFLVLLTAVAGCAKKTSEEASINGTGFDTVAVQDELSQLPPAGNQAQMTPIEALPIEPSPVTPNAQSVAIPLSVPSEVRAAVDLGGLTHEQKIQTALKAAGLYMGAIDGKIGPASKRAIEAFQKNNGLKVDGKVGPQTWAALEAYLNGQASSAAQDLSQNVSQ